jgi:hypothetical protein
MDVQWIGNTNHFPANGSITPSTDVWINTETWPINAAVSARVVYSTNFGATWTSVAMTRNGTLGNNDRWYVNLGTFSCWTIVRYAVEAVSPSRWDNNGGRDFRATVNTAAGELCANALRWNTHLATLTNVSSFNTDTRTYTLHSNATRRPEASVANPRNYAESAGKPVVRSGNALFDSLFALAYTEMASTLSVTQIQDESYNGGVAIDCPPSGSGGCFKTGVLWPYVWTRDSAYSVDLALAMMDPTRAMNTLNFKISPRRGGAASTAEIVQDTGSGGSWPVSTDRVTWARGAWELLKYLDGSARTTFRDAAYTAIRNTVEHDRVAVYDARDGLYAGEQSFLDWREQTYPSWTRDNVVHIGMSKTLSTNVGHWKILDVASQIAAEKGLTADRDTYRDWANALRDAINTQLWLAGPGLYSTMKTTEFDLSAVSRYDVLGEALAIIDGVADAIKTASVVERYPHTVSGVPVVWPQIRDTKIYHNRSIWPFAAAYWMKAAAIARNDSVVDHNLRSIMRGAGLNLSQMENYDFLTLSARQSDPDNRQGYGPDIDSEAQLWSVAGYLSAVMDVIFGRQATQTGIRFQPFVTKHMRNTLFATTGTVTLKNLPYKSKIVNVELVLPAANGSTSGYYDSSSVTLNGNTVANDAWFTAAGLATTNTVRVLLAAAAAAATTITIVTDNGDWKRFWAPNEPVITGITPSGGRLVVVWSPNGESAVTYNVYRNGTPVATGLTGTSWTDPHSGNYATQTLCYSVEQMYTGSFPVANYSHHAKPVCYWAPGTITTFSTGAGLTSLDGASTASDHGRRHFNNWGGTTEVLQAIFTPYTTASYAIQTEYGNNFDNPTTGITNCVKLIEVRHNATNALVASNVVMMPHLVNWDTWGDSSVARVSLTAGVAYKIQLKDYYNMSYLQSNAAYNGAGGSGGPVNRANISGLKILRMQ